MANEYKKPTAWDVTTGVTSPGNAYDTTTGGDATTAATRGVTGNTTASVTATHIIQTWQSPGQTYTALTLNMKCAFTTSDLTMYGAGEIADGSVAVSYSTDGTTWTPWYSWATSSQGSSSGVIDLPPVTLSTSQNFTNLKVKFVLTGYKGYKVPICKFDDACAYDGEVPIAGGAASIDIYDIWTDGTYSSGSISSFTTGLAIPTAKNAYGSVATLTCSFSGGTLSVTPGSWGTWTSGVGQSAGPIFTTTTWTATCGAATLDATAMIWDPTIGPLTFTNNPCTVGDLIGCSATISNATTAYSHPEYSIISGNGAGVTTWYPEGGGYPGNQFYAQQAGSVVVRAAVQGPAGSTVYSQATLTVYAAATGSLSGLASTSVNQTYSVTPTFTGGTAVLGTTQGASDIATGITSGVNYSRTAPASPGSQTTWMRVTNPAGAYIDRSFTTTTYALPTASISASTTNPLWGSPSVTVTPSGGGDVYQIYIGTSVYGAEISGNAANNTAVGVQTGGFTATTTYYSTVFNHAGAYVGSAGVTITPQTPQLTPITPANPSRTTANGESVAFVTTASGIYNTAISWFVDNIAGGNATVGTIDATGHYTPGTQLGAHTVKATLVNGTTVTTTVMVYAIPTCSLGASTTSPLYGASVTLTPTFANDFDNVAPIGTTQGGNQVAAGVASGSNTVVTPLVPTTYWCRATNGAGYNNDAQITITPQTVTMSNLGGNKLSFTVGGGGTCTCTGGVVTGAVVTTKTWYVDNIAGGNASVGTITSGGVYTPGTAVGAHTIKAVADADGTTNKTLTINIYAAPTITSFTVTPNPQLVNQIFTITGVFSNGTGILGSYQGGNDYQDPILTGVGVGISSAVPQTLDFWLRVTNPEGSYVDSHITETVVTSFASGGKKSACASSC